MPRSYDDLRDLTRGHVLSALFAVAAAIVEGRIYHDAGATTTQGLRRAELLQLIRKAGREPVERNTLYRPVQRSEATFTVLVWGGAPAAARRRASSR
jgi:hypothetical protein